MKINMNINQQQITQRNGLKTTWSPNFEAAPGNYINKQALTQKRELVTNLIPVFEQGKGFAEGIKNAIEKTFPMFAFKLGNISDLKYSSVRKDEPIVFSRTSFKNDNPLTFLYLDFPQIIDICKNGSKKQYEGLSEAIAYEAAMQNELHLISNVINMCTQKVKEASSLTIESIKKIVDECLKSFNISIENEVLNKKDATRMDKSLSQVTTPVTAVNYSEDNVKTKLCVIMEDSDYAVKKAISHEFTHALNANSIWFNNIEKELLSMPKAPYIKLNLEGVFADLWNQNKDFLKARTNVRGEKYEELLRNMLKNAPSKNERELVFKQIFTKVANESFAYSKTPGLTQEYSSPKVEGNVTSYSLPFGWFFQDYYDFMLSVKNNLGLYDSIINNIDKK